MFLSPLGERLGEGVTEGCLLHHPVTQPLPKGGEEHELYATFTTSFPKFSPLSRPMKASGACARPSITVSRLLSLPSFTSPPTSLTNSPIRATWSETMKP